MSSYPDQFAAVAIMESAIVHYSMSKEQRLWMTLAVSLLNLRRDIQIHKLELAYKL